MARQTVRRWSLMLTALSLFAIRGLHTPAHAQSGGNQPLQIESLSSRPDMVSGGDTLLRVLVPQSVALDQVKVTLNGQDVTATFKPEPDTHSLVGLVENLQEGKNQIAATAGTPRAELSVMNHPIGGPILYKPQIQPFLCNTDAFALYGLGKADDANCSVRTAISYFYKSNVPLPPGRGRAFGPPGPDGAAGPQAAGRGRGGRGAEPAGPTPLPAGFKPYDSVAPRPADMDRAEVHGKTVDYIVRVETGTINRAVYQIATLYQPGQAEPNPWTPSPNWNGRLVYVFGFGCGFPYQQGRQVANLLNSPSLADGYAVASSTLNVLNQNCNDVVSAETMMMVKEHFIERYGVPAYTIGQGGSGGAMQQHLIAQNYPGLLDGIMPAASFPDTINQWQIQADCTLLNHYFTDHHGNWTDEQRKAVGGYVTWSTCQSIGARPAYVSRCPGLGALGYDPVSNPKGARCDYQDYLVNVFGRDPKTGFARRPFDNTGVQYGLVALKAGLITPDQFLDLNKQVGGIDIDGGFSTERLKADPEVLRIAHETGRVDSGKGGLALIPIVDLRPYTELDNVHNRLNSLTMQLRLVAANGYNNQVSLTFPGGNGDPDATEGVGSRESRKAMVLMDAWLGNIRNDKSNAPVSVKLMRNKPEELVDACWTEAGEKIAEPITAKKDAACNKLYPFHDNPRVAAGAPVVAEPLKCELKPLSASAYKGFSPEQLKELKSVFPEGVCDYSKPSVGKVPVRTWLTWSKTEGQTLASASSTH